MTPTIIRYTTFNDHSANYMAQVVTFNDTHYGFTAVFQVYTIHPHIGSDYATLEYENPWSTEEKAIAEFDAWKRRAQAAWFAYEEDDDLGAELERRQEQITPGY